MESTSTRTELLSLVCALVQSGRYEVYLDKFKKEQDAIQALTGEARLILDELGYIVEHELP